MTPEQFGFWQSISRLHVITSAAVQKSEFSDFVDVKKAFETIDNSILLFALSQYGFTEKKQLITKIRSKQSDTVSKKYG